MRVTAVWWGGLVRDAKRSSITQLCYAVMVMHCPSGVHKFALNNSNRWGGREGFSTPKVSALQITPPVELSGNCHHSQMEALVSIVEPTSFQFLPLSCSLGIACASEVATATFKDSFKGFSVAGQRGGQRALQRSEGGVLSVVCVKDVRLKGKVWSHLW